MKKDQPDTFPDRDDRDAAIRKAVSDLIRSQRRLLTPPLTQEKLADLSGISFEHLNHIENYRATASVEVLDRVARAFGFRRLSEFLAQDESGAL